MQQRKYNKSDFIEAFDRMLDNVPYNEIDVKSLCFEVVNEPSRKVFYKNFILFKLQTNNLQSKSYSIYK